jgi:hypothetical protein
MYGVSIKAIVKKTNAVIPLFKTLATGKYAFAGGENIEGTIAEINLPKAIDAPILRSAGYRHNHTEAIDKIPTALAVQR